MLRYIETNSWIHQLNSTIKLLALLVISIGLFMIKNEIVLHIVLLITLLFFIMTKIPLLEYIKAMKGSFYIVLLTFLLNLPFSSFDYSFLIAYRIGIMVLITVLLTLTTKSMDLVYAITNLLSPLKLFGVNPRDISLMVGIAINFMPILRREYIIVKQAQMAKGFYPQIRHIKQYCYSIFLPYLTNCFKRVDEIALALQVKGYEGDF